MCIYYNSLCIYHLLIFVSVCICVCIYVSIYYLSLLSIFVSISIYLSIYLPPSLPVTLLADEGLMFRSISSSIIQCCTGSSGQCVASDSKVVLCRDQPWDPGGNTDRLLREMYSQRFSRSA